MPGYRPPRTTSCHRWVGPEHGATRAVALDREPDTETQLASLANGSYTTVRTRSRRLTNLESGSLITT
jgi:hypothetical protein